VIALLGFLVADVLGSLAVFGAYALPPTEAIRLTLLGLIGLSLGFIVGRLGPVVALVAFYAGLVFWPSVIHLYCAPEGCTPPPAEAYLMMARWYFPFAAYGTVMAIAGSLIRAQAWRRLRRTSSRA